MAKNFETILRGVFDYANPLKPFLPLQHYREVHGFSDWDSDACSGVWPDEDARDHQYALCQKFKYDYGFCLPTQEVMDLLQQIFVDFAGPRCRVLDAGSGSGFISQELCKRGISAFAVDLCDYENRARKFGYPIIQVHQRNALGDAVQFVGQGFDAVLLVWPPYNEDMGQPFALNVAQAMLPGQMLIYQGEDAGGCTGDDGFFEYLKNERVWTHRQDLSKRLNAVHIRFWGTHDYWHVYVKSSGA